MNDLEQKLKELERTRKKYDITYRNIAELVDMDLSNVRRYMKGITKPKSKIIDRLEMAINKLKKGDRTKINQEVQMLLSDECLKKYNLVEIPFLPGDVSKEFFLETPNLIDVENKIISAVTNNLFLLVHGEVGVGKSVLLQRIIKKIKRLPRQICIPISPLFVEYFKSTYLMDEIYEGLTNLRPPNSTQKKQKALAGAVIKALKAKKKIVVVIDEAQRLKPDMLRHIKRFHEGLGTITSDIIIPRFAIILVGQPGVIATLESATMSEVSQRKFEVELNPFAAGTSQEKESLITRYIDLKLKSASNGACNAGNVFTPGALKAIAERCETPLNVNVLCTNAIYQAYITKEPLVTEDVVNDI